MGKKRKEATGSGTAYLKIVNGAFWQTKNFDANDEFYAKETYTLSDGTEKEREGLKFNALSGVIQSGFVKDTDYGTIFNLYMEDEDGLYCIGFKVDGNWGSYNLLKRMIIALMVIDLDKEVELNVSSQEKDNGYIETTLWVMQDDKKFILNPYADESKYNESVVRIPSETKKLILSAPRIKKGEELTKKKKIRKREEELEQLLNILLEKFLKEKNEAIIEKLERQKAESEEKPAEKAAKKKEAEPATDDLPF